MKKFVYYARKIISAFGWTAFGCCLAVGIEYGVDPITICGFIVTVLVGILPNVDNEKPVDDDDDE
jgi:hypothetical protein